MTADTARVVQAIVKAYPLDKEKTIAMDFACGNGSHKFIRSGLRDSNCILLHTIGHVSKEMMPYVKSILGVDISLRMTERYNEKFPGEEPEASAICAELKGEEGELSGARFDIIFVRMYTWNMPAAD
jgi:hypothetical protein